MPATWILLSLVGCSEYGIKSRDGAEGGAWPDVRVEPLAVSFGEVALGESSGAKVVSVTNVGRGDLRVETLDLDPADGGFSVTALDGASLDGLTLGWGEQADFAVVFTPRTEGGASGDLWVLSDDGDEPAIAVSLDGLAPLLPRPDVALAPDTLDLGVLDPFTTTSGELVLSNRGEADLTVSGYAFTAGSDELQLVDPESAWGPPPWTLAPGESRTFNVTYAPTDAEADSAVLAVYSDDPDEPEVRATVIGDGVITEEIRTQWFVYDDGLAWETTSNPLYVVDRHGDADLYWYEPSGAHGLVDSADPAADFAVLSDYVRALGALTDPDGPFTFSSVSTLSTYQYANFTYVLCDFYLPSDADPSTYTISVGSVDDGLQVMVNGEILGRLMLGDGGEWPLSNAIPGALNTLVAILVDDSASARSLKELSFTHDGVMVE